MRTNKETKNVKERMRGLTYNQQGVHKKDRRNREIEEGAVLEKVITFFFFYRIDKRHESLDLGSKIKCAVR